MASEGAAVEEGTKETTAVDRAREYGIDLSLLESSLRLTPTERLIQNEGMLALVQEPERAMPPQHFPIQELLGRLLDLQVDFVIIGGVAALVHGSAYVTRDLDVCYSRSGESLERLVAALAPLHPRLRGAPSDLPLKWGPRTLRAGLNFTLDTDMGPIDLLGEVAGIGQYADAVAASELTTLFGRSCRILTLDALIRSKRAAGRPRDLEAVKELETLKDQGERDSR
jgi:hypothetical protein